MLSPSPTQQPPRPSSPEQPKDVAPLGKKPGKSPTAQFLKGLFRPIIKAIYYFLRWLRGHKLLASSIILLCAVSILLTSYLSTGLLPFGIGNDPFNFHVRGGNGGGDAVQNWLYALRDGNVTQLQLLDKDISQPPDSNQLVSQYSQSKAHLAWKSITVMGVYSQPDTSVDSFVQVEISANGPGGDTKGVLIWHFVTVSGQDNKEHLLKASLIDARAPLA